MAIVAPIIFNISIVLALALLFRQSRFLSGLLTHQIHFLSTRLIVIAMAFPAAVGFLLGTRRFATLLGHFFYTNFEEEKSLTKTVLCWLVFLLSAHLILREIQV